MAPVSGNTPSLFQSVKEGFGFGVGSTIARNLFSARPESAHHRTQDTATAAAARTVKKDQQKHVQEFKQCMETSNNNYEECVHHLE